MTTGSGIIFATLANQQVDNTACHSLPVNPSLKEL